MSKICNTGREAADKSSPPKDRFAIVYIIFLLMGVGCNLSLNVYITAKMYYQVRLAQEPTIDMVVNAFEPIFANIFQFFNFGALVFVVAYSKFIPPKGQVLYPCLTMFTVFFLTTLMVFDVTLPGTMQITATLLFIAIVGVASAFLQGGVYSLASNFPPIYMQSVMTGESLAGLAVAVLQFLTLLGSSAQLGKTTTSNDVTIPGFSYFGGSALVVALIILGYCLLFVIPFAQYYLKRVDGFHPHHYHDQEAGLDTTTTPLLQDNQVRPRCSLEGIPILSSSPFAASLVGSLPLASLDYGSPWTRDDDAHTNVTNINNLDLNNRKIIFEEDNSSEQPSPKGEQLLKPTQNENQTAKIDIDQQAVKRSWDFEDFLEHSEQLLDCHANNRDTDESKVKKDEKDMLAVKQNHHERNGFILDKGGDEDWSVQRRTKAISGYCLTIALLFIITWSGFPTISSDICSVQNPATVPPCIPRPVGVSRIFGDLFVPLGFIVFRIGDLSARIIAGLGPWKYTRPKSRWLVLYSSCRVLLVVALMFCNVVTKPEWIVPYYLRSDLAPWLILLLLGCSMGYGISTAMMHALTPLPPKEREAGGYILAFVVAVGVLGGSSLSWLIVTVLRQ